MANLLYPIHIVLAGQQPVEDGRERPYVPAIHVFELATM
jgi:hypothetical protein